MEKEIFKILENNISYVGQDDLNDEFEASTIEITNLMINFMQWLLFDQTQFEKTYGRMNVDQFYDRTIDDDVPIEYHTLKELFQYWINNN